MFAYGETQSISKPLENGRFVKKLTQFLGARTGEIDPLRTFSCRHSLNPSLPSLWNPPRP